MNETGSPTIVGVFEKGSKMRRVEISTTILLAVSAVVVSAVAHHLRSRETDIGIASDHEHLEYFGFWKEGLSIASPVGGDSTAPVTVIALIDYGCPASRRMHHVLTHLRQERGSDFRTFYVHYPLEYHKFSFGAARAAVCAEEEGYFLPMTGALLAKQDSLGKKSWAGYAIEAGIDDANQLQRCAEEAVSKPRIEAGLEFGSRVGLVMVPTVLVNGWRFRNPPTEEQLILALEAAILGQPLDEVIVPGEPRAVPTGEGPGRQ